MPVTQPLPVHQFVHDLFKAVDSLDARMVAPFIADDVHLQFGSAEPVDGKADFLASSRAFSESIAGLRHEIVQIWEPEPDTAIAVLQVHYRRHDGSEITLPCCNTFRLRDGLVIDYRVYMDINPVYAS